MGSFLLSIFAIHCFLVASDAAIHTYSNGFTSQVNSRYFNGGGEDLESSSFIRFDNVTFVRTLESARRQNATQSVTGMVEAIIVEGKDRDRIGATLFDSDAVCCTPEFAATGVCSLEEVIIKRDDDAANGDLDWPRRIKTYFQGNMTEAKMSQETVAINKTGLYELYFLICDTELEGTRITGRSVWKNPNGYLPANEAPLLRFYGIMSMAYLLLCFLWFLRFLRFLNQMTSVQNQITMVMALGMFDMAIQYYEYADFNVTGIRPLRVILLTVTFAAARKTICWVLLLLVAMGYGVLKPTQDGISLRMIILGVFLFLETEALQLVDRLGSSSGELMISLLIPVAFLDGCFIVWMFWSLARTIEILKIKRDMVRLLIYRNFTNTLVASVLVSTAWIPFEIYLYGSDLSGLQMGWIIPAFWHSLSFALLAAVCFIWAPFQRPSDYHRPGETQDSEIELQETSVSSV